MPADETNSKPLNFAVAVRSSGHLLHKHFLLLLIMSYILAAVLPSFGLWLRHISLGQVRWMDGTSLNVSISMVMLSVLLFNAGLGTKFREMRLLFRNPLVLCTGFAVNLVLPLVLVLSCRGVLNTWHSGDELQILLTGLALIAAMPVAGSSAAWAQNANGNLSLSLGLVFLSTIFSPLTTPFMLNQFGKITTGDYSEDLFELASQGANAFMWITVVLPSVLGLITHLVIGEQRADSLKPYLKLINMLVLLLLNYSNATTALPQVVRSPDLDFLVFMYATAFVLCLVAFVCGWLLARLFRSSDAERASLMFGLGMNNNGTGLVLAGATLADHWAVMLPLIFYTLVQQVLAAVVDKWMFKETPQDHSNRADQPIQ